MSDHYVEGFRARLNGAHIDDNPHQRMSYKWKTWLAGWLDQDIHLTNRDDALDSIGWFRSTPSSQLGGDTP